MIRGSTYMLFVKRGRGIAKVCGPMFSGEIESIKGKKFVGHKKVCVMEETAFESLYKEKYHTHIENFWLDKAFCYFSSINSWTGNVYQMTKENGFSCSWFSLFQRVKKDGEKILHFNSDVNANPFYVAKVLQDLKKIFVFKIEEGQPFYQGNNQVFYGGDKAIQRSLAETCVTEACLS